MNRHRKIISSAGLLAAIVVATPVAAHASPLLSGYGGPGQGSQVILGSSLLNGPGGGGGAAAAAAAAAKGSTAATRGGRGGLGGASGGSPSSSSASAVHGAHGVVLRPRSSSGAPAGSSGGTLGTSPARQAAPPALGVSEQDLLYIVLALGVLAFAGVLTRRLAYPGRGPARGAE
jgi:hypothetical protein